MTADQAHRHLEAALIVRDRETYAGERKTNARMAIDAENVRTAALVAIACELRERRAPRVGLDLDPSAPL